MPLIFNNSECDLDIIDAPGYPFVDDCQLIRSPEPIYECNGIEIPIDVPLALDTFCPDLFVAATIGITTDVTEEPFAEVHVTATKSPSSLSCGTGFDFTFNFGIPLPAFPDSFCPDIQAAATTHFAIGLEPAVRVTATRNVGSDSRCEFDFDFDVDLPLPPNPICPNVSAFADTFVTDSDDDPSAAVTVTRHADGSHCGHTFDFSFQMPRAADPICPAVVGSATMDFTYGSDTGVEVVSTRINDEDGCRNVLDFDFVFPHPACPDIAAVATTTMTETGDDPYVHVIVTRLSVGETFSSVTSNGEETVSVVGIGDCDYVIDFDFGLPPSFFPGGGGGPGGGGSSSDAGNEGDAAGTCGCCDCFDCVPAAAATVVDCPACPEGATYKYRAKVSKTSGWVAWPSLGNTIIVIHDGGCVWLSEEITVCQPDHGSVCGTYQWELDMAGQDTEFYPTLVSGTDVVGL